MEELKAQFLLEAKCLQDLRRDWYNDRATKEAMEAQAKKTADIYNQFAYALAKDRGMRVPARINWSVLMRSIDRFRSTIDRLQP